MTRGFRFTLIWLAGSFVAMIMSLNTLPASLVDGQYIPVGNDSFYHARRILDAVADSHSFYEFDSRIHFPEGSQIPWPWAYDYVVAKLVTAGSSLLPAQPPMKILAYIPFLAIALSIWLVVAASMALNLSSYAALLSVLCVALSPLTQVLHGIGAIDHHYTEYIFALAALWAGLRWMEQPDSTNRATLAGLVIGVAPSFHNGIFILQLPLLMTVALLWFRDRHLPLQATLVFAAALLLSTVAILVPSEPFRNGQFEFYLLSWFHLYVAACTAMAVILMAYFERDKRGVAIIGAFVLIVALPILRQAALGSTFVAGDLDMLKNIVEAQSVPAMLQLRGVSWIIDYYSMLLFTTPLIAAGCLWTILRKESTTARVLFAITSLGGLALLFAQFRFHPYGSFAIFLPLIFAVDKYFLHSSRRLLALCALTAVLAISYLPALEHRLFAPPPPGNDQYYALTRNVYPVLHELCARSSGLVLAGADAGNYIRFHTDCSVIANNFLLTKQDAEKLEEVKELLDLSPDQLLASDVHPLYVFASLADIASIEATGSIVARTDGELSNIKPTLISSLLFLPIEKLNPRFQVVTEMRFPGEDGAVYARLFQILP